MSEADQQETGATFADLTVERLDGGGTRERRPPWERQLSRQGRAWRVGFGAACLALLFALVLSVPNAGTLLRALVPQPATQRTGLIVVTSLIPWAHVWIDGQPRSDPDAVFAVPFGTHTVVVRATGFTPVTAQFTLDLANSIGNLTYQPQPTPQAAVAIATAVDDALTHSYQSVATVLVAPGQMYAPGLVAAEPLRGTLTVVLAESDRGALCPVRHPHPDQLPPCLGIFEFDGSSAADSSSASLVVRVILQFTITIRAGRPVRVYPLALPDGEPLEDLILMMLRPSGAGWESQVLMPFPPDPPATVLNVLQMIAGRAALQQTRTLPPDMLNPQVTFLPVPADGVIFTGKGAPGSAPVWLYRWGVLSAVNTAAQRLTPRALVASPALLTLVRQAGVKL